MNYDLGSFIAIVGNRQGHFQAAKALLRKAQGVLLSPYLGIFPSFLLWPAS